MHTCMFGRENYSSQARLMNRNLDSHGTLHISYVVYTCYEAHRMTFPFVRHCTVDLNLPAVRGRHSTVTVVPV